MRVVAKGQKVRIRIGRYAGQIGKVVTVAEDHPMKDFPGVGAYVHARGRFGIWFVPGALECANCGAVLVSPGSDEDGAGSAQKPSEDPREAEAEEATQ